MSSGLGPADPAPAAAAASRWLPRMRMSSFWRRSSMTLRCELECCVSTKVGLAAGRYSGTSRPDLKRTPHALHRVLGPSGPVLHCGVFSDAQCVHRRTPPSEPATASPPGPGLFLPRAGLLDDDGKSEDEQDDEDGDGCDGGRDTRECHAAAAGARE
uniref:Uncharacterized protein n=1 Tax=Zea mays TaxID=4577 RepID=A0A804LN79_MAIZE